MAQYRFVTEWHADASRLRVWNALLDVRAWPAWWKGFRAVEVLDAGQESGVGMRLRQRWRGLLPYTLTIDLEIDRIERGRLLEGRMSGDLDGRATWTMDERDGETRIRFVMAFRPGRRWMRLPLPFAGWVLARTYDTIMRQGGEGLDLLLGSGVEDRIAGVRLAGA